MQQRLPITIESQATPEGRAESPATPEGRARLPRRNDDWRIDDRTRRTGLRGLARARAALDATRPAEQSREPDAA
jgi:hypothetical protein